MELRFLILVGLVPWAQAQFSMPDTPYWLVWQAPSEECQHKFKMDFGPILTNGRIIYNPRDKFIGEYQAIYYPGGFGGFPYYHEGKMPPKNGGLPQLGDLNGHLAKAAKDVERTIPSPEFAGLGVIDMEEWRPLWERNWGWKDVYRSESRALTRRTYVEMNPSNSWIQDESIRQFNYKSRVWMVESLRVSLRLRPKGLWGYYHYPYCYNNQVPTTLHCKSEIQQGNDVMKWLWEESTAIYPSIYMFKRYTADNRARYMYGNIEEGLRVADLVGGRPVVAYSKMKYNSSLPVIYMTKEDMWSSMRMGADFGIEGTIIWGSRGDFLQQEYCNRGHHYVRTVVAPYARALMTFVELCSKKRCSGRGRCVHRGALQERYAKEIYRETIQELTDWTIDDKYSCRCYAGFGGRNCFSGAGRATASLTMVIMLLRLVL